MISTEKSTKTEWLCDSYYIIADRSTSLEWRQPKHAIQYR